MVIGITMIKSVPGHEKAIYESLKETEGLKEIYHLFGEFDFFLILEALDRDGISHILDQVKEDAHILNTWSILVTRDEDSIRKEAPPQMDIAFNRASAIAAG